MKEKLVELLAALRAQHWMYHTAHVQAAGPRAYQMHLLFERLYNTLAGQIDGLAEKMVNQLGAESVTATQVASQFSRLLENWYGSGDAVAVALKSERAVQQMLTEALKGEITPGMDNFLAGVADEHETNIYLLEQLGKGTDMNKQAYAAGFASVIKKAGLAQIAAKGKAVASRGAELLTGSKVDKIKQQYQPHVNRLFRSGDKARGRTYMDFGNRAIHAEKDKVRIARVGAGATAVGAAGVAANKKSAEHHVLGNLAGMAPGAAIGAPAGAAAGGGSGALVGALVQMLSKGKIKGGARIGAVGGAAAGGVGGAVAGGVRGAQTGGNAERTLQRLGRPIPGV
jgi:DNA-binding ferritin-like protein